MLFRSERVLGLDVAHARNPILHLPEDALKDLRMGIMKVFCDLLEVVSRDREVIGISNRLLDASSHTDVKIRNVPVFYQLTQFIGCLELLELSQPLDGEDIPLSQVLPFLRQLLVRPVEILLVRDRFPNAAGEVQEVEGRPMSSSFVAQNLAHDARRLPLKPSLDRKSVV